MFVYKRLFLVKKLCITMGVAAAFTLTLLTSNAHSKEPIVWIFRTDLTGAMNQRIGIAEKLTSHYQIKDFPPGRAPIEPVAFMKAQLGADYDRLEAWPNVIINTEPWEHEADLLLNIKKLSRGKTLVVHLENPKYRNSEFDLIVNATHLPDISGANVIRPIGVATRINSQKLEELKVLWQDRLGWLPHPIFSVALGGDALHNPYPPAMAQDLAIRVRNLMKKYGGSVIATNSRRTPKLATELFLRSMKDVLTYFYDWHRDPESANPYPASLGFADYLISGGDSLSMLSDAVATGKPLYIHAPAGTILPEHQRMTEDLFVQGIARPLTGLELKDWTYTPLDLASTVAEEIRKKLTCQAPLVDAEPSLMDSALPLRIQPLE